MKLRSTSGRHDQKGTYGGIDWEIVQRKFGERSGTTNEAESALRVRDSAHIVKLQTSNFFRTLDH